MADEEKREPLEPARFWQLVATELIARQLDREGFEQADQSLNEALSELENGCAGNPETTCAKAAIELIDEFAGLAAGAGVLKEPGVQCKHPARAPRPFCLTAGPPFRCVADFTGLCQWCDERIEGKGVVGDG